MDRLTVLFWGATSSQPASNRVNVIMKIVAIDILLLALAVFAAEPKPDAKAAFWPRNRNGLVQS